MPNDPFPIKLKMVKNVNDIRADHGHIGRYKKGCGGINTLLNTENVVTIEARKLYENIIKKKKV